MQKLHLPLQKIIKFFLHQKIKGIKFFFRNFEEAPIVPIFESDLYRRMPASQRRLPSTQRNENPDSCDRNYEK